MHVSLQLVLTRIILTKTIIQHTIMYTSKQAAQECFLNLVRELVYTYQTFTTYSGAHIRSLDLTTPQFDVLTTLGNTQGMTCKELGEKTLITKGTLTGILDRLVEKGLITRIAGTEDRRTSQIALTAKGEALFEEVFPAHILHLKAQFEKLTETERHEAIEALAKIRKLFPQA